MRQAPARLRGGLSRVVPALVAVLVALASTGCGPTVVTSLPPVPQEKPPTGTVRLVMTDIAPSVGVQQPGFVDRGSQCMRGRGSHCFDRPIVSVVPAPPAAPSTTALILLGALLPVSLAFDPLGTTAAIGMAVIATDAWKSTRTVLLAFADMRVAETFEDEILVAGRAYRIVPSVGKSPGTEMPAVDTFLELEGPRISLVSDDITDWSPDLQLRVGAFARLVRAADRTELGRWSWKHAGSTVRLADWSENDARLFRTELEAALRAIASQAIEDLAPDPVQTDAGEKRESARNS
jgi:hypothetical protein